MKETEIEKEKGLSKFYPNTKLATIRLPNTLFIDRKSKMDPSWNMIYKSVELIKIHWNNNVSSRNFIKHLISNFIPMELNNKITSFKYHADLEKRAVVQETHKCAILGIKLVGINDLIEIYQTVNPLVSEIKTTEDENIKNNLMVKLNGIIEKMPIEYREYSIAYYSLNSTKLLSIHALYALNYFVEQALLLCDKDMQFTITKIRLKDNPIVKNAKISKTEINSIAKASSFGVKNHHLSEKTFNALNKLKVTLENHD